MYLRLTPELAICSPWHLCWPRPGRKLLRLSYSRTFPIKHPSTRLCLELLASACQERNYSSLLDVGCGSGILALAGVRLGVPFCLGCDLSAAAVQVSRDNARRLNLEGQTAWVQGSTEALKPAFDLIAANLPFDIQVAKIKELVGLCHPQGGIILSGFRDTQEREIAAGYLACGWRVQRRLTRDLWELEVPAEKSYTWVGLFFSTAG